MFAIARASAGPTKAGLARSNLITPRFFYAAAASTSTYPALALGLRPGLRPVIRSYAVQTSTTTTSTTKTTAPASEKTAAAQTTAATPETKQVVPEVNKETGVAPAKKDKPTGPWYQRAWAVTKKEAAHYWAGTKLLGSEIKISSKLQWKVLNGGALTRRERRQLRRTTADLLRLLPFSIFIIIPFMEFLLPIALKLFPNMLPSTFEGQLAKDEKERKLLRVRIEMAKFLQETVKDSGLKAENRVVESDEFKEFFRKVRTTGETPSTEDVIRVAKLFNNDITLDNLTRPQLVSMCKYMNIHAFGTDNFLKHQINNRLDKIRVDDMMIHAEGIDSLSIPEIHSACQSRGIRVTGVSPARLREELSQWVDLHYTNGISGVLLILSRAFNFESKSEDVVSSLATTLGSLPDPLIDEAELSVSDEKDYKQKLTVLEQQQELIDDEAEQEQEEREARQKQHEADEAAKAEKEQAAKAAAEAAAAAAPADAKVSTEAAATSTDATGAVPAAAQAGTVHPGAAVSVEPPTPEKPAIEDAKMTKEQIGELAEALSLFTAKSSIEKERQELKAILEDNLLSEAESKEHPEEADAKVIAVSKKVRSMLKKIDAQLEKYDERVGNSLNLIHTNARGEIFVHDLQAALRAIKHAPAEELIESLSNKLDPDGDGLVPLDHVLELASHDDGLGLGLLLDDEAEHLLNKGDQLRQSSDVKDVKNAKSLKDLKPNRKDLIKEE